jgi:hypothetical protein
MPVMISSTPKSLQLRLYHRPCTVFFERQFRLRAQIATPRRHVFVKSGDVIVDGHRFS